MNKKVVQRIRRIIGPEHVQNSKEDLICYSYDATTETMAPDLVVHPGSTTEVVSIINTASEAGIPVIPRGAGTGLSGGSLAARGGIMIHFDRMNQIKKIDRDNLVAVVEAGVINWDLKQAALDVGLFYPPDPGSSKFCTLGGNVAENAGGPYGTRYGVTGDFVMGLEAVLATGDVIKTGGETRRDVSGYDLTSLLVGSEGTLAVVTEITLKLLPKPDARRTALIGFNSIDDAAKAIQVITTTGVQTSALEIMDKTVLTCVDAYMPGEIPVEPAMLLLEVDGTEECVASQYSKAAEAVRAQGGWEVKTAEADASEDLWEIRRAVSPSLGRAAVSKVGEDISVPVSKIHMMMERIDEISRRHELRIAVFGHAGDGNLHPNILTDRRDAEMMKRTQAAIGDLFDTAIELGGTLSGEHGIGTAKSGYMSKAVPGETLALMKLVKELFDPGDILNPGKIFPE